MAHQSSSRFHSYRNKSAFPESVCRTTAKQRASQRSKKTKTIQFTNTTERYDCAQLSVDQQSSLWLTTPSRAICMIKLNTWPNIECGRFPYYSNSRFRPFRLAGLCHPSLPHSPLPSTLAFVCFSILGGLNWTWINVWASSKWINKRLCSFDCCHMERSMYGGRRARRSATSTPSS